MIEWIALVAAISVNFTVAYMIFWELRRILFGPKKDEKESVSC